MKVHRLLVAATVLSFAACGDDDPGTGPGPMTQTLASVRLTTATFAVDAGDMVTLVPEALDANGAVIAGVTGYTFSSSAPTIVEARSGAEFLAISAGDAELTVSLTRDGVTADAMADVTVTGMLPTTATVVAADNANTFTPQTVVVALNADVTYSFGARVHNVTYGSTAGAPTNVPDTNDANIDRTFTTAGDFSYDCTIHAGMTGEVIVR